VRAVSASATLHEKVSRTLRRADDQGLLGQPATHPVGLLDLIEGQFAADALVGLEDAGEDSPSGLVTRAMRRT
jgi:hypothetical protein